MYQKKIVSVMLILAAVLFASLQISPALAAASTEAVTATPTSNPTSIPALTGTVQSIVLQTDAATGKTTVRVKLTDSSGAKSTVEISLDEAIALGLVSLNVNGMPVVNSSSIGTVVTITPGSVVTSPEQHPFLNPVGEAIANFFGVDPAEIASQHAEGAGYGVIAQACWMSYRIVGDASICTAIVDAKLSKTVQEITLPDGSTISISNWGQFKKAYSDKKADHQNLGGIMSGHATPILPGVLPTPVPANDQYQNSPTDPGNHGNKGNHGGSSGNHGNGNNK